MAPLKRVGCSPRRYGLIVIPRPRGRGPIEASGLGGREGGTGATFHDREVVTPLKLKHLFHCNAGAKERTFDHREAVAAVQVRLCYGRATTRARCWPPSFPRRERTQGCRHGRRAARRANRRLRGPRRARGGAARRGGEVAPPDPVAGLDEIPLGGHAGPVAVDLEVPPAPPGRVAGDALDPLHEVLDPSAAGGRHAVRRPERLEARRQLDALLERRPAGRPEVHGDRHLDRARVGVAGATG